MAGVMPFNTIDRPRWWKAMVDAVKDKYASCICGQ